MLVTVARTEMAPEAHILRGRLEAEGIPAFVEHEHHVTADWFVSNALGGVKLQVPVEHAPAAAKVLRQWERGEFVLPSDPSGDQADATFATAADAAPACPKCGADGEPEPRQRRGVALAFLYLLALPMPWRREQWRCARCGQRWFTPGTTPYGIGTAVLGSLLLLAAALLFLVLIGIAINGLCRNTRICPSPAAHALRATDPWQVGGRPTHPVRSTATMTRSVVNVQRAV